MYKNRVVLIIVFSGIAFFIFRHCTVIGASCIETVSSYCLYPLLRIQKAVVAPITQWFGYSAALQELEKSFDVVRLERDVLFAENIALKATHYYADETRELSDFNKRYLLARGHIAQVLARHFSSSNQFFLVDAGSTHGIKKDMVALYGNAIVGRVAQVYPWYCKVCLVTDADCKVASLCLPSNQPFKALPKSGPKKGASGIHEGINDSLHTVMRYVSHLTSVDLNNDVISSGEGMVFPRGFALGKVIAADKGELFYTITIQPALDFQALRYCTLIAKEDI